MDERTRDDREVKKLLRQARTLSHWSIIGLIFPLAGWILGGIALSKLRSVREDYLEDSKPLADKYETRVSHIRSTTKTMIILSIMAFIIVSVVFVGSLYTSNQARLAAIHAQNTAECKAGWISPYDQMQAAGQTNGHSLAWYTNGACGPPAYEP